MDGWVGVNGFMSVIRFGSSYQLNLLNLSTIYILFLTARCGRL